MREPCRLRFPFSHAFHSILFAISVSFAANLALGDDPQSSQKAFPVGTAKCELEIEQTKFDVFTYKPKGYKDGPLVMVFHGMNRNADEYRDHAITLADRTGALIAAPLFDSDRFPSRMYQRGGLVTAEGKTRPPSERTWHFVPLMADQLRKLVGKPDMPYYMIGHSGGAQFLSRLAGFQQTDAKRIVVANPGSLLFPTAEQDYPYGFGKLPKELNDEKTLKQYLAQPLTIYQGTADVVVDEYLDDSEQANIQGKNRFERGQNAFHAAEKLAKQHGWNFNWRLAAAKGVGHDGEKMLADPACDTALFGEKK